MSCDGLRKMDAERTDGTAGNAQGLPEGVRLVRRVVTDVRSAPFLKTSKTKRTLNRVSF